MTRSEHELLNAVALALREISPPYNQRYLTRHLEELEAESGRMLAEQPPQEPPT